MGKIETLKIKLSFGLYKLCEYLRFFLRCGGLGEEQVWGCGGNLGFKFMMLKHSSRGASGGSVSVQLLISA